MNELSNVKMPKIKIWNDQRVVTFKDIDEVHQRPQGTAKTAFNRNRKRFIKDVDYFIVTRSDSQKYAKDTLENFGDTNHNRTLSRVEDEDKMTLPITDAIGRKQNAIFVNESGLYSILFAMQPQKANNNGVSDAYLIEVQERISKIKRFKHWVTSEVLPSIRKHGMYAVDELIANPELAIKAFTALKEEREKNKALQAENERMKPKEEFFNAVTDSKDAIDIGQVAKVLNFPGIGRNKLFEILRNNGILKQNNEPYQKYIDCGYFRVIEQKYEARPGEIRINIKTLVFQKGVDYIRKILDKVA